MDNKYQKCILTNMILIYKGDEILVINRKKKDWPGLTFPGGHVEKDETILESVFREAKEETGLELLEVKPCGVYEWPWEDGSRYIAFLYKSNKFRGAIKSSKEGEVFLINRHDINKFDLSQDFVELLNIMIEN